jgi:predicted RNase H-like HicB family nuclease
MYVLALEKLAMKSSTVVEHEPETKSYTASCPELPGRCSAGDTLEEVLANAIEAIDLFADGRCNRHIIGVETKEVRGRLVTG